MTKEEILGKYVEAKNTPSDINEHMETLLNYANKCNHVTEFGVRGVVSTWAFLASNADKVISYDIFDVAVPVIEKFTFICADDLQVEIEQTDMLFIDTLHFYDQLKAELNLHHSKVNKYIAMHDTEIYKDNGEFGKGGLMLAIREFLAEHREFSMEFQTPINNGLTILRRI